MKKRNKKYNPTLAFKRQARDVAENALNRIAFVGASNRAIQPYGGRSFQYTVSRNVRVIVSSALAETLFEDHRTWRLWMCHYANSPEGVVTETVVLTLDDYTLNDFNQHIKLLVDHTKPKEFGDADYIGYAFFCAPNDRYDLESGLTDERLIENFMASGVLEKDTHLSETQLFVSKEQLIIKLMADHHKFDVNVSSKGDDGDDYVVTSTEEKV